ncbi:terminase small subunit [Pedobacter fastidiosus]|uniref:Terminase small subunit n=1 Tax=Pedobacter fastidiosus TaxID=2765361 RepID=A0ABR7KPQ5_9SPHI|nr:terminase small subunit [Pedobacter fastidiosus]MBC6109944.1 terminase small subunit [Pedobacter fastidiosus]
MTHKQNKFISEYLKSGNATEAAKFAGYSEKTAYSAGQRLLKNVEILNEISKYHNNAIANAEITVAGVITMIKNIALNGKIEGNRLRAMDLLMRHLGAYTDELKIISSMKDHEIDELVKRLITKLN